jgi:hypothetical protein
VVLLFDAPPAVAPKGQTAAISTIGLIARRAYRSGPQKRAENYGFDLRVVLP